MKKWFDMVLNGKKNVEYRDIKTLYLTRLIDFKTIGYHEKLEIYEESHEYPEDTPESIKNLLDENKIQFKPYKTVTFSNGMKPISILPRFEIELLKIEIAQGEPEYGAKEGELYFCLHLGKVLNNQNC